MPKLGKIRDLLTIYGVFGVLEEVSDRRKCWTLSSKLLNQNVSKTSISDATPYVMVCELANSDKEIFTNFRRCLEYRLVLEHVNRRFGKKYLQLASGNPNWRSYLEKINTQNRIGNPILKNFKGIGKTSPTSLRYLKVLTDLEELFGNLNSMNIAEIGAGFGGQAHAITSNFEIAKYSIFDLPEVNRLIKFFLASLINTNNFVFVDGRGDLNSNFKFDLVISNYAFSELNRETQEKYLNSVLLNSKRGYITWNELSFRSMNGFSKDELLGLIPNSFIIPEEPLTYPNNAIIAWGPNLQSQS